MSGGHCDFQTCRRKFLLLPSVLPKCFHSLELKRLSAGKFVLPDSYRLAVRFLLRRTSEPSSTRQSHDEQKRQESNQFICRIRCYSGPIIVPEAVCRQIRMLQEPLCDEIEIAGGADSFESHDLAASLNAEITSGVRERDVELAVVNAESLESDTSPIHIISEPCKERFLGFFLAIAFLVPCILVVSVVANEWISSPSQRGWLILGFAFYIMTAMRYLWKYFIEVFEGMYYLKVELRRLVCPTLFDAVTNGIAKKVEQQGRTCSRDQETVQTHDEVTGDFEVKFRFWSSQARTVHLQIDGNTTGTQLDELNEQHENTCVTVKVQYYPGEDIVTGRDSRVERREVMVLTVRTSTKKVLAVKKVLQQWLEDCYNKWVQPDASVVKVFALEETSSDWVPTWACYRKKPFKSTSGSGQTFYLARNCLRNVLADAKLWSNTALRVYLVYGPPGVGKSEFTIWLAGQMQLPVYRLCLSNPRLTDDRLAQLLSQSAITYNSVLIQVDEFQQTVARWVRSAKCESNIDKIQGLLQEAFVNVLRVRQRWGVE